MQIHLDLCEFYLTDINMSGFISLGEEGSFLIQKQVPLLNHI